MSTSAKLYVATLVVAAIAAIIVIALYAPENSALAAIPLTLLAIAEIIRRLVIDGDDDATT